MAPQPPQLTRRVYAAIGMALMAFWMFGAPPLTAQTGTAPGGFLESAASLTTRPRLSAAQIQGFLPSRGRFTFPAPYNTEGIRLTNASDCGGADCVLSVGYSYWRNINNHSGSNTMLIVLGLERRKGGGGPTLFSYDKTTGAVQNLGPLFPATSNYSYATGEGWYFSASHPTMLYLQDGARMMRYDVLSRSLSTVFDASTQFGANRYLWQTHTSSDDRVHSFTLKDSSSYAALGCGVFFEATGQYQFVPARMDFDECQIDKSGRYLVIKDQVDGANGEDNVIIDLSTGGQKMHYDPDGAGGHSDLGFGYHVAEDNWHSKPGAVRVWNLAGDPGDGSHGRLVFHVTDWSFGSNHVAHSNSRPGVSLDQQVACSANASRQLLPRTNEVLCYKLDGSLQVLVVAPVMTDLDAPGGVDDYWKLPKGNIDVTGEYFIWSSNMGGSRMDTFIARVPLGLLASAPAPAPVAPTSPTPTDPTPAPAPAPAPAPSPAPTTATAVTWIDQVNVTVVGDELRKQGGCDGCHDAGAVSLQQLTSGDGYVEVTVNDVTAGRWIGLSQGNPGTTSGEIAFALRLGLGYVEVREKGAYRSDTGIAVGDILRIEVASGKVYYRKNGTAFYTSTVTPAYPMLVDTSLHSIGATLSHVMIASASSSTSPSPAPAPAPEPAPAPAPAPAPTVSAPLVTWTHLRNVTVEPDRLRKTGGCFGCPDATAVSSETISDGDGYLELVVGDGGMSLVGFTRRTAPAVRDFDFAVRIDGGVAEVRERGTYRDQVAVVAGDALRITVGGGRVTYAKNGVTFRTVNAKDVGTVRAGALIYLTNGWVWTPGLSR